MLEIRLSITTNATTPITTVTKPRTDMFSFTFLFGRDSPLKIGIVSYFVMLVKSPTSHTNEMTLYLVVWGVLPLDFVSEFSTFSGSSWPAYMPKPPVPGTFYRSGSCCIAPSVSL